MNGRWQLPALNILLKKCRKIQIRKVKAKNMYLFERIDKL